MRFYVFLCLALLVPAVPAFANRARVEVGKRHVEIGRTANGHRVKTSSRWLSHKVPAGKIGDFNFANAAMSIHSDDGIRAAVMTAADMRLEKPFDAVLRLLPQIGRIRIDRTVFVYTGGARLTNELDGDYGRRLDFHPLITEMRQHLQRYANLNVPPGLGLRFTHKEEGPSRGSDLDVQADHAGPLFLTRDNARIAVETDGPWVSVRARILVEANGSETVHGIWGHETLVLRNLSD